MPGFVGAERPGRIFLDFIMDLYPSDEERNMVMKINVFKQFMAAVMFISLTGCKQQISVSAKSADIEYGKEKQRAVDLLDMEDTSKVSADPEEIDTSKVGSIEVQYKVNNKDAGSIQYTVKDTQLPVISIPSSDIAVKTKGKLDSKITVEDPVDGTLKKADKAPEASETDASKIGMADYYKEGWYTLDTSKIDFSKAGEYPVALTASDIHGNTVIVNYYVTVSDDGKKSNYAATAQIITSDQDMSLDNVSIDKVSDIISDFNEVSVDDFKDLYKSELGSVASAKPEATSAPSKAEEKKTDTKKEDTSKAEESKKDSSGTASTNNKNTQSNTKSNSGSTASNAATHTHNWVAQYTTIHHDAQYSTVHHDATGHYETQTVSEGYYSEEPKYATGYMNKCFGCGLTELDFGNDWDRFISHVGAEGSRYGMVWGTWQIGTEQVWHDPVTQQIWVEDSSAYDEQVKVSDAYDEQVISGYKCSSCGATK